MAEARLVVVEDEPSLALPLTDRLRREGFDVLHAADGTRGLDLARGDDIDLVLLDLMLPSLSGTQVLKRLRDGGSSVAVICLTARTAEHDRVEHLVAGADDYVTKPFSLDELVARVRAVLRRTGGARKPSAVVRIDGLEIDVAGHTVRRGEKADALSQTEAGILGCLLDRRGSAVARSEILDRVWGRYAAVTDRTIDFHVKNLRRKIERDPERPELLVTVHGVGYRFA